MLNSLGRISVLYFITHISNLKSILEEGILSHNEVKNLKLAHKDLSNQDVQKRREDNYKFKKLVGNGKNLHDFTNLYWNPNNSMMSVLICNQKVFNQIVVLEIDALSLYRTGNWVISDGNAASSSTNFFNEENITDKIINNIKQSCMKDTSQFVSENKRRMCAEFLYPRKVPSECIMKISCPTNKVHTKVHEILKESGQNKINIVDPNNFFRYKKQGSGERVSFGKVNLYQGDAFYAPADAIVVSTNTIGVMADPKKVLIGKGGLAGTYRLKCPLGYLHFKKLCRNGLIKLGKPAVVDFDDFAPVSNIASIEENDLLQRYHIYFPTKIRPSYYEKSTIPAIRDGLISLIEQLSSLPIKQISMPALGCGLGELSFQNDVLPLIIHYGNKFKNSKGEIIFTYLFMPQDLSSDQEAKIMSQENKKYIDLEPV